MESFASTQQEILEKVSSLEKKALELPKMMEKGENDNGGVLSSFDKKALELQYRTSAQAKMRKLLAEILEVERRALKIQFTASAREAQRKILAEISALEKRALTLQYTTR